ncbi:hypothetical protein HMPREF0083_01492 [Aneurinibacillus aneurinilyticus ATCC 12856]|uniref:Uncharacterized protein n=1 Tax=Aneurinibacillus aneurinilyticus ATCC 12856 TaxID=649747 RepID=U1X797_ANEAE|nr:hypothetical protein HMPREF0083_01492 [Aneurinibacillus aneurinilyticus ATCC 12856]
MFHPSQIIKNNMLNFPLLFYQIFYRQSADIFFVYINERIFLFYNERKGGKRSG